MRRLCPSWPCYVPLLCGGAPRAQESQEEKREEENPAAAAPAAAAPPAPTKPELIDGAKINSGDTAWMLASTALVLLMTIPGLALFYGGMVRKKRSEERRVGKECRSRWSPYH